MLLRSKEANEALLVEYKIVADDLRFRLRNETALLSIGYVIISAVLLHGYVKEIYTIFLIAPYSISFFCFYLLHNSTDIISLGGYKRYLEEKIFNESNNGPICGWESFVVSKRPNSFSNSQTAVNFFFFLSILSFHAICLRFIYYIYELSVFVFSYLLSSLLLFIMYRISKSMDMMYEETYALCLREDYEGRLCKKIKVKAGAG